MRTVQCHVEEYAVAATIILTAVPASPNATTAAEHLRQTGRLQSPAVGACIRATQVSNGATVDFYADGLRVVRIRILKGDNDGYFQGFTILISRAADRLKCGLIMRFSDAH